MMQGSDIDYNFEVAAKIHPKELIGFIMGGKIPKGLEKLKDYDIDICRDQVFEDLNFIFSIRVEAIKDEDLTVQGGIQDFLLEIINAAAKDKGNTRDFDEVYKKCQENLSSKFQVSQLFEESTTLQDSFKKVIDECKQKPKTSKAYFEQKSIQIKIEEDELIDKGEILSEIWENISLDDIMQEQEFIDGFTFGEKFTFGDKVMMFFEKLATAVVNAFSKFKRNEKNDLNELDDILVDFAETVEKGDEKIAEVMNKESEKLNAGKGSKEK